MLVPNKKYYISIINVFKEICFPTIGGNKGNTG